MSDRLNSDQIAWELERLGAILYRAPMYAMTYVLPGTTERVCVKRGQQGRPMATQPLVIHPKHRGSSHWNALCDLLGQPNLEYRNADLHGFPSAPNGTSKVGIAFNVSSPTVLPQVVALLGGAPPAIEDPRLIAARLELEGDPTFTAATKTERQQLVAARVGQGLFRANLLRYWDHRCAVSGCRVPEVLIASHIQPWAMSTNSQRLDPNNGLLLAGHIDRLFDRGLISFADQGEMLISKTLPLPELAILGVPEPGRLSHLDAAHTAYLAKHRLKHGFN